MKSRFSEQQIAFILRQTEEGTTVEEMCHKAVISQATTGGTSMAG
jgi:putative transposase